MSQHKGFKMTGAWIETQSPRKGEILETIHSNLEINVDGTIPSDLVCRSIFFLYISYRDQANRYILLS